MYIGQLVAAMYTDNLWYRARIVGCHEDMFQVFYVDYGSKNLVKIERLRHLHMRFTKMPLQVYFHIIFIVYSLLDFCPDSFRLFEVEFSAFDPCPPRQNGRSNQENGSWILSKVIPLIFGCLLLIFYVFGVIFHVICIARLQNYRCCQND